jgi:hypothetical protein
MPNWVDAHDSARFWDRGTPDGELFTTAQAALALGLGRNSLSRLGIPDLVVQGKRCYRKGTVLAFLRSKDGLSKLIELRKHERLQWLRREFAGWKRQNRRDLPRHTLGTGPDWDAAIKAAEVLTHAEFAALDGPLADQLLEYETHLCPPWPDDGDAEKAWTRMFDKHFREELERRGLASRHIKSVAPRAS